jgi:hypothetical protein
VLGNFSKREKFKGRSLAKSNQTCTSMWWTSNCLVCTGHCQAGALGEQTILGKSQSAAAIIHRTVRCVSRTLSQRSIARTTGATCAQPAVTRSHQTVWCAMGLEAGNSRIRQTRNGITHCSLSGSAPDCPACPTDRRQPKPTKWSSNGS